MFHWLPRVWSAITLIPCSIAGGAGHFHRVSLAWAGKARIVFSTFGTNSHLFTSFTRVIFCDYMIFIGLLGGIKGELRCPVPSNSHLIVRTRSHFHIVPVAPPGTSASDQNSTQIDIWAILRPSINKGVCQTPNVDNKIGIFSFFWRKLRKAGIFDSECRRQEPGDRRKKAKGKDFRILCPFGVAQDGFSA